MMVSRKIVRMLILISALIFSSCQKDEEGRSVQDFLEMPEANYMAGSFPAASTGDQLPAVTDVSGNSFVIRGGSNMLTIQTSLPVAKFLLGIQGAKGFYEINETLQAVSSTYLLPVLFSARLPGKNFILKIACVGQTGLLSEAFKLPVSIVEAGTGVLQISLSWNKPYDLDLHLVEPDGEEIFYSNKISANGGSLDLDSNPGCSIDGIQNENITYSKESIVETGIYRVRVDLFSACSVPSEASFIVCTRLNGRLIAQQSLQNPYLGYFPANAVGDYGGEGDGLQVMEFLINQDQLKSTP
jgi:hypothetical protein